MKHNHRYARGVLFTSQCEVHTKSSLQCWQSNVQQIRSQKPSRWSGLLQVAQNCHCTLNKRGHFRKCDISNVHPTKKKRLLKNVYEWEPWPISFQVTWTSTIVIFIPSIPLSLTFPSRRPPSHSSLVGGRCHLCFQVIIIYWQVVWQIMSMK